MSYDVFISYSHGGDDLLSERVQEGLTKFAKPWYRRRALNVFRDRTALSANPGLWTSITDAIEDSRYFLVLASPDAAASVWCQREVEHWRSKHGSEGLLVLLTEGEILWDEETNDFDWNATTALGPAIAGAFSEEPFHIDMRWARSAEQLDLTDGRFRDQVADLAAPVHGMAKDELASEDVRQHRRAVRLAIGAAVALALLTVAAITTSVFAVKATARARTAQHNADAQRHVALIETGKAVSANGLAQRRLGQVEAGNKVIRAGEKVIRARSHDLKIANGNLNTAVTNLSISNVNLSTANTNLIKGGLALRKSTLLAEARLAARRSQQLMSSGDQTYQLGVALSAEAVRHACASSAIDPTVATATDNYPDAGCLQPGIGIDGSVSSGALLSLSNAGGRFVTSQRAGPATQYQDNGSALDAWSADSRRFATFASAQSNRPSVVQVWNTDGSLAATATSAAGLNPEVALSGDGTVLGLTGNAAGGLGAVSAWSLTSQSAVDPGSLGRLPSLSADGSTMAWLAPNNADAIEIATRGSAPRRVALTFQPVGVAVSGDGSLVAAVVDRRANLYSLVPIDVATGRAGAPLDLGGFGALSGSPWDNPPREVPTETADPPAVSFAAGGSTVWVYNNERHVGAALARTVSAPTAKVVKIRTVPPGFNAGSLTNLQTSTPDGRSAVFLNPSGSPTYQIWSLSPTGWTTAGVASLELCSSNPCSLSISPDGSQLAVSSVSALQIIHVLAPASTSSGIVPNPGVVPRGTRVVMGPAGGSALSWSPQAIVMIDQNAHVERSLAVRLSPSEVIAAVGFDPSGARAIVIIATHDACPCRVVLLDAATGNVVGGVALGATALDHMPHDTPVGVTLNDSGDVVAVTFDDNATGTSGSHQCALATYALATGQPLQVIENASVGLGEQLVSVPAFQPGTNIVALVATQGASREVGGVLVDARSGAIVHTLGMRPGVVTVDPNLYGNDGYALGFTPDGQQLAWNTGGGVVVWDVGSAASGQAVLTDIVLTSVSPFDPTSLAITDNGEVATVGLNFYTDVDGVHGTYSVLTGDELGRLLQPLGIARLSPANAQPSGRMSVAMPADGQIAAVALDDSGTRFFTDSWGTTPDALLSQLCAAAARPLSPAEWDIYFPGEPYAPACTQPLAPASFAIDASPMAATTLAWQSPAVSAPRAAAAASLSEVPGGVRVELLACDVAVPASGENPAGVSGSLSARGCRRSRWSSGAAPPSLS